MRILENMIEEGHLDGNLCDLLVQKGVFLEYARSCLPANQVDGFIWRGKTFGVGGE